MIYYSSAPFSGRSFWPDNETSYWRDNENVCCRTRYAAKTLITGRPDNKILSSSETNFRYPVDQITNPDYN